MKRETWLWVIPQLLLICAMPSAAQEKGVWRAQSTTAQSITGDVTLSNDKLSINFSSYPMARIRALDAAEASAVFETDSNTGGGGSLYRLSVPGSKRFLHRNTLCGSEDVQWMAAYVSGRSLYIAFFSGAKEPVLKPEAIAGTTDLCGTFSYMR